MFGGVFGAPGASPFGPAGLQPDAGAAAAPAVVGEKPGMAMAAGLPPRPPAYITPVTLKSVQTSQSTDGKDVTIYGGFSAQDILVVAQVVKIEKKDTNFELIVSDGTATMKATRFVGEQDNHIREALNQIAETSYVRILGRIKCNQKDKSRSVGIHQISPIADPNEIAFHQVEAIYEGVRWAKENGSAGNGESNKMDIAAIKFPVADPKPAAPAAAPTQSIADTFKNFYTSVGQRGGTYEDLVMHCKKAMFQDDSIKTHFDQLVEDCDLFNTTDEAHWALIDE